jgi:hypothetical protein
MGKKTFHNISSTTLFNFTDTFERLQGNLKDGFYCGDVYERLPFDEKTGYKVPMVCFCDIPLGQIKKHLVWYGNYAIGIKRDYARQNNVSPVWYIHKTSPVILSMFKSRDSQELKTSPILPYLKQVFGYQKDQAGEEKKKKFYDEREWRYIPADVNNNAQLVKGNSHSENEKAVNKKKRTTKMALDLNAIEYIIVRDEEEKEKLYPKLRELSKKRKVEYEKLVSSILTSNQIIKDF